MISGQNGTEIDRISFRAPRTMKSSKRRSGTDGVAYRHKEGYQLHGRASGGRHHCAGCRQSGVYVLVLFSEGIFRDDRVRAFGVHQKPQTVPGSSGPSENGCEDH